QLHSAFCRLGVALSRFGMLRQPPSPPLLPYTTLFRSEEHRVASFVLGQQDELGTRALSVPTAHPASHSLGPGDGRDRDETSSVVHGGREVRRGTLVLDRGDDGPVGHPQHRGAGRHAAHPTSRSDGCPAAGLVLWCPAPCSSSAPGGASGSVSSIETRSAAAPRPERVTRTSRLRRWPSPAPAPVPPSARTPSPTGAPGHAAA